ncbi:MAG: hypothetical protein Q9220_007698 [cf. Caloplaca sp. 1 TL-2023]
MIEAYLSAALATELDAEFTPKHGQNVLVSYLSASKDPEVEKLLLDNQIRQPWSKGAAELPDPGYYFSPFTLMSLNENSKISSTSASLLAYMLNVYVAPRDVQSPHRSSYGHLAERPERKPLVDPLENLYPPDRLVVNLQSLLKIPQPSRLRA